MSGNTRNKSIGFMLLLSLLLLPLLFLTPTFAQGGEEENLEIGAIEQNPTASSIVYGAHLQPILYNNTEIEAFNQLIGKEAGIVMVFYSWGIQLDDSFCGFLDHTFKHGPRPNVDCGNQPSGPEHKDMTIMLTWEPNANPPAPYECPVFQNGKTNLDAIINGSCDSYIDEFASRIKKWNETHGDKFMIRFMHEMNIDDSPWWSHDKDNPAKFQEAFRHVYNRFRAQGASTEAAQFVWSINYASSPNVAWNSIPNYYPGDEYVEWIGLSGYNWYTWLQQPWLTFSELYDAPDPQLDNQGVLRYLMCHYAKPIALTEFGSAEGPGGEQTKSVWLTDAYATMQNFPFVRAAIWFNDYAFADRLHADLRVTESSAYSTPNKDHYPGFHNSFGTVTEAFKTAVQSSVFVDKVPPLSEITPTSTYCGEIPPPFVDPSLAISDGMLARPGDTIQVPVTLTNIEGNYTLAVSDLPSGYDASFAPSTIGPADNASVMLTITVPQNASLGPVSLTVQATSAGLTTLSDNLTLTIVDTIHRLYLPASIK